MVCVLVVFCWDGLMMGYVMFRVWFCDGSGMCFWDVLAMVCVWDALWMIVGVCWGWVRYGLKLCCRWCVGMVCVCDELLMVLGMCVVDGVVILCVMRL